MRHGLACRAARGQALLETLLVAMVAVPLVYLIFFLVGFPLMMMLVPIHLLSGVIIGLIAAKSFSTDLRSH